MGNQPPRPLDEEERELFEYILNKLPGREVGLGSTFRIDLSRFRDRLDYIGGVVNTELWRNGIHGSYIVGEWPVWRFKYGDSLNDKNPAATPGAD